MPNHKVVELVARYEDLIATLSHLLVTKGRIKGHTTALRTHLNEQRLGLVQEIEELRYQLELSGDW